MYDRNLFFRISYMTHATHKASQRTAGVALAKTALSLSLLINPVPIQSAEWGLWVARQSAQIIAGVMGAKIGSLLSPKGPGQFGIIPSHASDYEFDKTMEKLKNSQSVKVDTANQGGLGTASEKRAPSEKATNTEIKTDGFISSGLGVFSKAKNMTDASLHEEVLPKWSDFQLKQEIEDTENYIGKYRNKGNSRNIKPSHIENALSSYKKHLEFLNKEVESRKESGLKERIAKQATTITATAIVLTTQTTPTSPPQALEKGGESPKENNKNEKKDKKQQIPAPKDPPPHESGQALEFIGKDKPGQHSHQWRNEGGHFAEDTETARELIRRTVKEGNYRGIRNGKYQYDWINPETGEQVWVETMGTKIQNHGLNIKPWEKNAEGFIEAPHGYQRSQTGVVRCEATGAIIWPIVPALMDKLERENEKANPIPDTEVRKLANVAINNYLKENPIYGNPIIKMPTTNHTVPSAYKTDTFVVPSKATAIEAVIKDSGCKCGKSWWNSYTPPAKPSPISYDDDDTVTWTSKSKKLRRTEQKLEGWGHRPSDPLTPEYIARGTIWKKTVSLAAPKKD